MATEESSRIFVRGLPPTMNEEDFKKHFGKYPITDTRLFPQRRIGYVGYKTPEDAVKAVKYFNKTFIRMSKIAVELARPVCASISTTPQHSPPLPPLLNTHHSHYHHFIADDNKRLVKPQPASNINLTLTPPPTSSRPPPMPHLSSSTLPRH